MENSEPLHTMTESEESNWALLAHLGTFIGMLIPFGNILTPLLAWQVNKDKSEFVAYHGKEALNFKITMLIVYIICGLLCIVLIGIPLLIIAFVLDVIWSIQGAIKAGRDEYFDYPYNFRLIK